MRIGLLLEFHAGDYDQPMPDPAVTHATMDAMIEEALTAERHGFHSVSVPDRHGRTECFFPGPFQALTTLARETDRVALGSFTQVATLMHPMLAAEMFSVIDNMSEGRLFTTLSRGYHEGYWKQFGIPREKLLGRFIESLAVTKEALLGGRFDFEGKHYQVEDGLLVPQPYQPGGWPIWGGGNAVDAAIRRSADYGECWTCDDFPLRPDVWERQSNLYRDRARELGKEPYVVLMRDGWVADSFEEAAAVFGQHYADEMRFYYRQGIFTHHPDFTSVEDITPERCAPHVIMGTPERCIEQIEMYHEDYGVDYIVWRCRMPRGPSLEEAREQVARFGEEVVQPIHRKYAAPQHPAIPAACRW